jgi:CheY-like chemotaxis protein
MNVMKPLDRKRELSSLIEPHWNISSGADLRRLLKESRNQNTAYWPAPETVPEEKSADAPARATPVYIVDNEPQLTELYSIVLESAGYVPKPFNDRIEALAALKTETHKPALLIMDYLGHPMPTERFMERCRFLHPTLRILVATGFNEFDRRLPSVRPDGFIQKPFTAKAFLQQVRATLEP